VEHLQCSCASSWQLVGISGTCRVLHTSKFTLLLADNSEQISCNLLLLCQLIFRPVLVFKFVEICMQYSKGCCWRLLYTLLGSCMSLCGWNWISWFLLIFPLMFLEENLLLCVTQILMFCFYSSLYMDTRNTHTFNGPLSGSTRVSRYQKGKTNLDFTGARDSELQWHQLGDMQVCTSLQTDNHASTSLLKFFTGWMPFLLPNQQCQSTEGTVWTPGNRLIIVLCWFLSLSSRRLSINNSVAVMDWMPFQTTVSWHCDLFWRTH